MDTEVFDLGFIADDFKNRYPSGAVYALGFFDGVHIAHREILRLAKNLAKQLSVPFGVISFPAEGEGIKGGGRRIYSTEEKLDILNDFHVDVTVLCDFDYVKNMSATEFANVLKDKLLIKGAVCGYNFRFGKGGCGDAPLLASLMKNYGVPTVIGEEYKLDGVSVSSSLIKEMILAKRPEEAAKLLGSPYFIESEVVHGRGVGKTMGIPTVNTNLPDYMLTPPYGVYESAVKIKGSLYPALTNVGVCPTFGNMGCHGETYILDFNGDLYGEKIKIYLLRYLREEKTFDSPEELTREIEKNIKEVLSTGRERLWQRIGLK